MGSSCDQHSKQTVASLFALVRTRHNHVLMNFLNCMYWTYEYLMRMIRYLFYQKVLS